MNSREIVRRIIAHDSPERFGYNFVVTEYNDMGYTGSRGYLG